MAREDFISLHIINISMKPVRISEVEVTLLLLDIHMVLKSFKQYGSILFFA
jgi:hypothetical protein